MSFITAGGVSYAHRAAHRGAIDWLMATTLLVMLMATRLEGWDRSSRGSQPTQRFAVMGVPKTPSTETPMPGSEGGDKVTLGGR